MNVAYLRTSVWKEHKVSIEAQREIIQQQITSSGEGLHYFLDKGYSGFNMERPGFKELEDWVISSNLQRILYVSRYDRISRNLKDALNFLELCQQYNVEVVSVLEPIPSSLVSKQAAQSLFVQILFSLAEFSRNVIIENINNSLVHKKSKNKMLSSKVPFGYKYVNKKFIIDKADAEIVQYIFSQYTSTSIGYSKLANKLNKQLKMFKGKEFKSYHIAQILKNPIYNGIVGSKSMNLSSYQSTEIESIISQETFQLASEKRLIRTQSKKDTRRYPLRKKISCPNCGRNLNPRKQLVREKEYFYYACHNEDCSQLVVNAELLEIEVLKITKNYLMDQTQLKLLIEAVKIQIENQNKMKKQQVVNLNKEKEKLFNQYEQGLVSSEELKKLLKKLTSSVNQANQIELSEKALEMRLKKLLQFSNTQSQEMIWTYIDEAVIDKEKNIQEVIIYGIRIQPCRT